MKYIVYISLLLIGLPKLSIGNTATDSIINLINTTKLDTVKILAYEQLGANYRSVDEDSAFMFNQKAIDIANGLKDEKFLAETYREYALTAQAIGKYPIATEYYSKCLSIFKASKDKDGMANSYNDIGISYYYAGDYTKARENFEQSGVLKLEIGDSIGSGQSFNNTGIMYDIMGKPKKAIKLYFKALDIYENAKDTNLIIGTISNVGLIYIGQKNYKEALKIYERQKKLAKSFGSKQHYAGALSSLGTVFDYQGEYEKARPYFFEALEIYQELNLKHLISQSYNNLSVNFELTNENEKALEYALKSLKIKEEIGLHGKLAVSQIAAAKAYGKLNNHTKSIELYKKALDHATATNYYDYIIKSHKGLSLSYSKLGRYKDAFYHQAKFIELNDSILNEENSKIINELEKKYENEKKQKEIEILNKDNLLKDATIAKTGEENKRKSMQLYFAVVGLIAILILALLIYRNNRQKKKSNVLLIQKNDEISHQKLIVEEKNREITDSIKYAKRIQSAILPPDKVVKEYLQESFILYKPKDIVAGDFYWMESVSSTDKNDEVKILFAAADCTGHGVPGAMVSVVCNNALNRSVREHGLTDPGEILNKTREIVVEEFEKSHEDVKDGMDIALCSLEGNKLLYAGAHNPLWIIRDGEIMETKANKQPIGKFDHPQPYTTHSYDLQKGDTLYIFSDGFVDQFGGEKGKKFKARAFKDLLVSNQDKTMDEQKTIIDETFETWKGNLEQIDDVCVIGVRI